MGYIEKKQELISFRDEILRDYQALVLKTLAFGSLTSEMANMRMLPHEQMDFVKFIANDEATMKITSLMSLLLYVEHPEDKDIVEALERDIAINRRGRK